MAGVVCLGDATDHGGNVITASSSLYYEGKQAALVGDKVSCPLPGHGVNVIVQGCDSVLEQGRAVVVDGCLCQCGCHVLTSMPHHSVEV